MTKNTGKYHKAGRYVKRCKVCNIKMVFSHYCMANGAKSRKCCSPECVSENFRILRAGKTSALKGTIKVPKVDRTCSHCSKVFKVKWWRTTKHCSKKCYYKSRIGKKASKETRAKISAASKKNGVMKRLHKDPEFQRRRLAGLHAHPNRPEIIVTKLLDRLYPSEYKFTGNGSLIIDGLNPDFANVNGQKKLIEVFGRVFHDPTTTFKKIPFRATEKGRRRAFRKFGYRILVIWEEEISLKDKTKKKLLIEKIRDFHEDRDY